jgi:UDP-N-acetylglucosamine--N-acetylmuramyl-(pentapeptide) pyrophosphoryl-undecaprenol N-acetylglucosamine transferase
MRIIIAAGGTGGHLYPGIAIAREIRKETENAEILFAVTRKAGEMKTVSDEGFTCYAIPSRGFLGKRRMEKMVLPLYLAYAAVIFLSILVKKHPRVIVGTGGFATFVPVLLGVLCGIPTVISEQDSHPGLTTRMLSRFVTEVHLAHERAGGALKARRVFVTGNPIRDSILEGTRADALKHFGLEERMKTVFIVGGSHGARSINRAFVDVLKYHRFSGVQFIFQTGRTDFEWIVKMLGEPKCPVRVLPYIERMNLAYAAADLMFSRAGALTLAELMARGVASVLIPFPYATGGHQEENARYLEKLGAAVVLRDHELEPERIATMIETLIHDDNRLQSMRTSARALSKPNAASLLARRVVALGRGGRFVS